MGVFRILLLTAFVGSSVVLGGVGSSGAAPLAGLSSAAKSPWPKSPWPKSPWPKSPWPKSPWAIAGSGEDIVPEPVHARRYYQRHYRGYDPYRHFRPHYRPYKYHYAPRPYYRPSHRRYHYRGW